MNTIDLKGRNAIITGAASGIGKASAERLSKSGATVALWDLPSESLENTKKLLNMNCFTVEANGLFLSPSPRTVERLCFNDSFI